MLPSRRNFLSAPAALAAGAASASFLPAVALAKELEESQRKAINYDGQALEIPNDGTPASAAIQKQIDETGSVYLRPGKYLLDRPLIPRPGGGTVIRGSGGEVTTFILPSKSSAIKYIRKNGEPSAKVLIDGVSFLGHDMSSIGVIFHGVDGTDDDTLSVTNSRFEGLLNCVWLRNCGECHFDRLSVRYNVVGWVMERATNVVKFSGVLCVTNRRFLHLDDEAADGYTHGISLTNTHAIFCSEEDIYLVGGQAIYIDGCSFDLGIGGAAAIVLKKCQDVRFSNGWICAGAEGRDGIYVENTNRWSLSTSTVNNCYRGIIVRGPGPYPTAGTVLGNQFGANRLNDIFLAGDVTSLIVQANQFTSRHETFPDIQNRQEIAASGEGNKQNIVANNTFASRSYAISAGDESIVEPNVWNAKGFFIKLAFEKYDINFIPVHARFSLNDGKTLPALLNSYI